MSNYIMEFNDDNRIKFVIAQANVEQVVRVIRVSGNVNLIQLLQWLYNTEELCHGLFICGLCMDEDLLDLTCNRAFTAMKENETIADVLGCGRVYHSPLSQALLELGPWLQ